MTGRLCAMHQSTPVPAVAILFQHIDPPVINGLRKPRKPGGYQDSGADIAYVLQKNGIRVITPWTSPDPYDDEGWCFPDSERGILAAVRQGATHLWTNTILFSSHPLQTSSALREYGPHLRIVGPHPGMVDRFDDKAYLNDKLRERGGFTFPRSWLVKASDDIEYLVNSLDKEKQFPIVGKPVRGRGSHQVKVCHDAADLRNHITTILQESPVIMLEEFLSGEEVTITVMPPSDNCPRYWSLPPVTRFNPDGEIAPYNGSVAVMRNSQVVTEEDVMQDHSYSAVQRQCERVAELIQTASPIRIDARRFSEGSPFALFDINMKPNMTGPGRPGREDQASLTAMAAADVGWDYATLLQKMLETARVLDVVRNYQPPF